MADNTRPEGEKNPCSGTLNKSKNKRSDNSPDMWGFLKIDQHLLNFVQGEMDKGNDLPEIRLLAWKKEGKYGTFISILADVKDVQGPPARAGGQQGRPAAGYRTGGTARYMPPKRSGGDDLPF